MDYGELVLKIEYIRSSSYNSHSLCEFQYWLDYGLGIKSFPKKRADLGNICHKALEILAMAKQCQQNNELSFLETESKKVISNKVNHHEAVQIAWDYYTNGPAKVHEWTQEDKDECDKLIDDFVKFNDGQFSPMHANVYFPEKYFDLEIKREDATYLNDNGEKCYLRIRGTVDLVVKIDDGIYELRDYKTGAKKNWATGQPKTYEDLREDPQLLLYFYALKRIIPDAKQIIITILYIRDGGPTSMAFDDRDFVKAEQMIVDKFNEIKKCKKPKRIYPADPCFIFCEYAKRDKNKNKVKNYTDSICFQMNQELQQIGLEKMENKYLNKETVSSYDGGGKIGKKTN